MSRCKTGQFRHWELESCQAYLRQLARRAARGRYVPRGLLLDIEEQRERVATTKRDLAEHDSWCEQCAGVAKP